MNNAIKLAADIGGTFTDIVLEQASTGAGAASC